MIGGREGMSGADVVSMQTIGYVSSCFKEKFGIPRQPGLASEAKGILRLLPEYSSIDSVRGLEAFSHLWLIFHFHATADQGWKPTVRPPRLGGNERVGVFASRSMFRPNPIGLSVVELDAIKQVKNCLELHLNGVDLLDGTPVLDIKPYLPYADKLEQATGGFAISAPFIERKVVFSDKALRQCALKAEWLQVDVSALIVQVLMQDPRPSYRLGEDDGRVYGVRLYDFDVRWSCRADTIEISELVDS